MEAVHHDYRDKINFFFVYKSLAHPEINGFIQPFNLKERLKHIAVAKERLHTEIPWLSDTMSNEVSAAFGYPPNGEFVLDPEGVIVRKRFWSNAETLRADLETLVGKVEKVTQVADLKKVFVPPKIEIASGVVPRLKLPRGLGALKVTPIEMDDDPFFAKLRVEGTRGLANGVGSLYFGLYLDPIYNVHWNNQAGKVTLELETEGVLKVDRATMTSSAVDVDADIDPRQFLVKAKTLDRGGVFIATVTYTVCDDRETFCKTLTQMYEIELGTNRTEGTRPGIFINDMFYDVRKLDKNNDGDLTVNELPKGRLTLFMGHMDYDANGVIESAEIDRFLAMFNNGRGIVEHDDGYQEPKKAKETDQN